MMGGCTELDADGVRSRNGLFDARLSLMLFCNTSCSVVLSTNESKVEVLANLRKDVAANLSTSRR